MFYFRCEKCKNFLFLYKITVEVHEMLMIMEKNGQNQFIFAKTPSQYMLFSGRRRFILILTRNGANFVGLICRVLVA